MLLMKRIVLLYVLCQLLICTGVFAQAPKDKSIFWELTPKGGGKSSYLYGTMHVSKKVAFRLSDKFYDAIKQSDVVALESNPETWNEELEKSEDIQTLYDLTAIGLNASLNYNRPYYSSIYSVRPINNNSIRSELAYEPHSANELLFRSYGLQKNFEEDTYLDLYIYKTGRKYGKPIASLENVLWSMMTVIKASFASEGKKNTKPYEGNLEQDMEDAYREQDLVKLDSIQKASARSEAYLQGLLYTRNDTMFASIEKMIKQNKSVFAAVGAAHLGGEKGLLLKFIKAGYTVKAIQDASQLDPSSKILALDTVYLPVNFKQQFSRDSTIRFVAPTYTSRSIPFGKVEYLSTDMTNGVYYYIGRLNTFTGLSGLTTKNIEQKFDSLLFENVKGTILDKKKIDWQGYPCLMITNRTKDGNLHKQRIIITPLEILFCKVVGKEHYFAHNNVDTFLNSIQIHYQQTKSTIQLPELSVQMPCSIQDHPFSRIAYNAPDLMLQGIDMQGDYFQFLKNYSVRQVEHEEDTFHVNMSAYFLLRDLKLKAREQKNGIVHGLPAVDILAENEAKKHVYVRVIQRASNFYYLIACTEQKEKAMNYFNSFQVKQDITLETNWYVDTARDFTVKTHAKPLAGELSDAIFNQNMENAAKTEKRKPKYTAVFGEYDLGYQFTFNMQEINKYECYEHIDSFWNSYFREYRLQHDPENKLVMQRKTWSAHDQHYIQINTTDTNTQNKSVFVAVTTGNKILEMVSFYDTTQKSYRFIDTAIATLRFMHPKPSELLRSKLDTFLVHMVSKDSTTKEYFNDNKQYLCILTQDEPRLTAILDTSETLAKRDELYTSLLFELNQFKKPNTLQLIKKLYKRNEENSARQISLLNVLSYMEDTASALLFKDLLLDSPPLEFDDDDDPVNHYFDTLSLAKLLYPEFLDLTDIDDYRYDVFYLTKELLLDKRIDSALYASKVNYFTLKAKEEIRRKASQKSSLEQEQDSEEEENEEDMKTDAYVSANKTFDVNNEKDSYQGAINFSDFYLIRTFASLLKPYRSREHVKEFFVKIDSTNNKDLRFDMALWNMKKKLPFNKDIIVEYAALPKYRYSILHSFYFEQNWDQLPIKVKDQQEVAQWRIMQEAELKTSDQISFVYKLWLQNKYDQGYVYLFKHKKEKDDDFYYDVMGLFSKDGKKMLPERSLLLCNVTLEKKNLQQLKDDLYNQFRVLNRMYVTPQQMVEGKEEDDMSIMQMINSMREN